MISRIDANRKIVVCTTFREFNGDANDQIQRLFLSSLRKQTNQNYLLVVTIFKERNVEQVLKEGGVPFVIFQGDAGQHRFSFTHVMLNGIKVAKEFDDSILVWTTCDMIFSEDFFTILLKKIKGDSCGTSYPHIIYSQIEDFKQIRNNKYYWIGIDTIFFGSDSFRNTAFEESVLRYPNYGWGHFEFFLSALGLVYSKKMLNFWPYTKLNKVENNRIEAKETSEYLSSSDKINKLSFEKFMEDFNVDKNRGDLILSYQFHFINNWRMRSWIKKNSPYVIKKPFTYRDIKYRFLNKHIELYGLLKKIKGGICNI